MAVYLVYCGHDMKSYIAPLEIADSFDLAQPPVRTLGWRTIAREGQGTLETTHPAREFGSIQMVVSGAVEVGVTGGTLRQISAGAGDLVVFTDNEGDGHWARRNHKDRFTAVNIRLAPDWEGLRKAFTGWPGDMRPLRD